MRLDHDQMKPFRVREKLDGFRNGKPCTITIRDADGNEIVVTGEIEDFALTGGATLRETAQPGSPRLVGHETADPWVRVSIGVKVDQVVFPAERVPPLAEE